MKRVPVVAVSGYFNPLHIGHIRLIKAAKKLGRLVVIVNNDRQVKCKGGVPFMNEHERMEIIASLKQVDDVVLSIDDDMPVSKTLEMIKPDIFCNGGDRTAENIPELDTCKKIGCRVLFGVGGPKIQSSSELIRKSKNKR